MIGGRLMLFATLAVAAAGADRADAQEAIAHPPATERPATTAELQQQVTAVREQLRNMQAQQKELVETLDLLYGRFLAVRLSAAWAGELDRVRRWLTRVDQKAA